MVQKKLVAIGDVCAWVSGQGPAVVFCHGFTTTSEFWKSQAEDLSANHTVVCINLPGHGISPAPRERAYTMAAFVDDLHAVFTTLGLKDAVLVGLSMGGTVSQLFALKHGSLLRGLVLVGATPHGLGEDVDAARVLEAIDVYGVAKASQNVIERSFAPSASRELIDFGKGEVVQTPEHVARQAIVSLNGSDTRDRLSGIALPTLVICGTEDTITPPRESVQLAAGIPGARLHMVEGAGHFPMLEAPQAFNAVLGAFLAEQTC
ncbi:alpha/beta fold hydrolase [Cupriavidus sp. 2TAF22]|uniref:alpha/beta fold hydrolase n=1 Tax=unclassified Cupriavidus TaxID=2640874 RepID=UPI003F8E596B